VTFILKALAFTCWRLRSLMGLPDDGSSDWRIIGLLNGVVTATAFSAVFLSSIVMGCQLFTENTFVFLGFMFAGAVFCGYPGEAHVRALLERFEPHFRSLSQRRRVTGTILMVGAILGALAVFLLSARIATQLPRVMCFS
jgi:hypothetical protein